MEKSNSEFNVLVENLIESEVLKRLSEREIDYKKAIEKEIVDETLRSLLGGFKLGDEVWFIKTDYTKEKCQMCIEKGELIVDLNGEEIKVECPKCDGLGFINKKNRTVEKGEVNEIRTHTWANGEHFKAEMYIKPTSYNSLNSIHKSFDRLFKTKEECERQK